MQEIHVDDRVVAKANPSFLGTVTRVNPGNTSGYVVFDQAPSPIPLPPPEEVFYQAEELDPAP